MTDKETSNFFDSVKTKAKSLLKKEEVPENEVPKKEETPYRVTAAVKEKVKFLKRIKDWIINFSLYEATIGKLVRMGLYFCLFLLVIVFGYHNFVKKDAGQIDHCYLSLDRTFFEKEKEVKINLWGYRRWNVDRLIGTFDNVGEAVVASRQINCNLK